MKWNKDHMTGKPLIYPVRPTWDAYFLDVAQAISRRGECLRSQVGAVLVDHNRRIIATGYNGTAPATQSCLDGICPRAQNNVPSQTDYNTAEGHCVAIHAEMNAIRDALDRGLHFHGTTIYLTKAPCLNCTGVLSTFELRVIHP
jgi:dCMP deaminase